MPIQSDTKGRPVFLTIWLSFIIIINAIGAILYFLNSQAIAEQTPLPMWVALAMGAMMALNVICAIALFKWKKWGFWGICLVAAIGCIINITYAVTTIPYAILASFIGPLILFAALRIGKEKAWSRLT